MFPKQLKYEMKESETNTFMSKLAARTEDFRCKNEALVFGVYSMLSIHIIKMELGRMEIDSISLWASSEVD